jgi:hypothetical protein
MSTTCPAGASPAHKPLTRARHELHDGRQQLLDSVDGACTKPLYERLPTRGIGNLLLGAGTHPRSQSQLDSDNAWHAWPAAHANG